MSVYYLYEKLKEDYIMYIENTKLEDIVAPQNLVEDIMARQGLECTGAWDYDRKTFDRRFDVREGRYYLRVFTYAKSGDVGAHNAELCILKPVIGKYYYPHGVEYGEDEVFPTHLVKKCEELLANVQKDFAEMGITAQ